MWRQIVYSKKVTYHITLAIQKNIAEKYDSKISLIERQKKALLLAASEEQRKWWRANVREYFIGA